MPPGVDQTDDDTEDDVIELGHVGKDKGKVHKPSRFSLHHSNSKEVADPKPSYEVSTGTMVKHLELT